LGCVWPKIVALDNRDDENKLVYEIRVERRREVVAVGFDEHDI